LQGTEAQGDIDHAACQREEIQAPHHHLRPQLLQLLSPRMHQGLFIARAARVPQSLSRCHFKCKIACLLTFGWLVAFFSGECGGGTCWRKHTGGFFSVVFFASLLLLLRRRRTIPQIEHAFIYQLPFITFFRLSELASSKTSFSTLGRREAFVAPL